MISLFVRLQIIDCHTETLKGGLSMSAFDARESVVFQEKLFHCKLKEFLVRRQDKSGG